jgi:hypothetical protein
MMLACFGSVAFAQQPTGFPPSLDVILTLTPEKGLLTVERVVTVTEQRAILEKIVVNGQEQLPREEVWKRLKTKKAIAISGDSNMPATAYLRALNPETLVLIPSPPKNNPVPKESK